MPARRATDDAGRRREDELEAYAEQLEELLEHGSRNFRRYRRRAMLVFAMLTIMSTLALFFAVNNARQGRDDLAAAGATVARRGCEWDNELQRRNVQYIVRIMPSQSRSRALETARDVFVPRDCAVAQEPLVQTK